MQTLLALPLALLAPCADPAPPAPAEAVRVVEGLDNPGLGVDAGRVPWWAADEGRMPGPAPAGGVLLEEGQRIWQPLAMYAPLASELVLTGSFAGEAVLRVIEDGAVVLERGWSGPLDEERAFRVEGSELERALGRPPMPRLVVELSATGPARWIEARARVALPAPTSEELHAELLEHLDGIVATWIERAGDRYGRRETAFYARDFDARTGEAMGTPRASMHPVHPLFTDVVWPLVEAGEGGVWAERLDRYIEDLLEYGIHPETGLPRYWRPEADRPDDDRPVQVARPLAFLIDVAERGPERWREPAREAALRVGEAVLATGLFPSGAIATTYRPSDGHAIQDAPHLARLHVPAQLARLAALSGDERYAAAARDALLEVDYAIHWSGNWVAIDPGFDDTFGNHGARAVIMARALPGERAFRAFLLDAVRHYAPIWRDTLRFGGNVAADQVRCWRIYADTAELEPELAPLADRLIEAASRSHFKGGQREGGAWIDVTIVGFDPRNLPVGDLGGLPQNLLEGLVVAYAAAEGELREDQRARYTAVMRSTVETYGADFGFLGAVDPATGRSPAIGSIRFAIPAAEMVAALAEEMQLAEEARLAEGSAEGER
jgi:hypothetical protein